MTAFDFDARQYKLLLGVLRELGSRRELTSQLGLSDSAMGYMGLGWVALGALVSLPVLGHPAARDFLLGLAAISSFVLIPILVSEAAEAFMNPAEVSVLAHRPIRGGSYIAAKVTYVVRAAAGTALPLNLVPAFAGLLLAETRWFYPLTHLLATLAASVFTALVTCGFFGVLFRLIPLARVRTAALVTQIATMGMVPVLPHVMRLSRLQFDLAAGYWSAVPLTWFTAMGLMGQAGRPEIAWRFALPAMIVSAVLIAIGVRALSRHYMMHAGTLMRVSRARPPRHRAKWLGSFAALAAGSQSGRAAAAFVGKMVLRDWQFRRAFFQTNFGIIILAGLMVARTGLGSPLGEGGHASAAHALPHLIGLMLVSTCQFLAFSDHYRAAWIFLTVPTVSLRGFVRGLYWGLWTLLIGVPHVALLVFGAWSWGPVTAVVFTMYSLALATFYLGATLWLVNGLPFSKAPKPGKATGAIGVTTAFLVLGGILAAIQYLVIFPRVGLVLSATLVLGAAAWAGAMTSFTIVEGNIRSTLDLLTAGPNRMFRGSEDHDS